MLVTRSPNTFQLFTWTLLGVLAFERHCNRREVSARPFTRDAGLQPSDGAEPKSAPVSQPAAD
jgi:hypothetical protein